MAEAKAAGWPQAFAVKFAKLVNSEGWWRCGEGGLGDVKISPDLEHPDVGAMAHA
jgi:hypothetical protein